MSRPNQGSQRGRGSRESTDYPEVPCRSYPISQVLQTRDRLLGVLRQWYVGVEVDAAVFQDLLGVIEEALPVRFPCPETLVDSVRHLLGGRLTEADAFNVSYRLAGNLSRLRGGRPVPPWTGQRSPEWVPLHVLAAARHTRGHRPGCTFTCRVLAGTPCPALIRKWLSVKLCRHLAPEFGFSRPQSPRARQPARYPYSVPEQLVSMRLYGLLLPELCDQGPAVGPVRLLPSLRPWNSGLVKSRARIDLGHDCPKGYTPDLACHRCRFGYETCPAGTHRYNYTEGLCGHCGREDALFDRALPPGRCVDCFRVAAARGEV